MNDPSRPATLENPAAVDGALFDGGGPGLSAAGRAGDGGAGFITRNGGGLPICGGSGRRPNAPARLERGVLAFFGIVGVGGIVAGVVAFAGIVAFAGMAGTVAGSERSASVCGTGRCGIDMPA